MNINRLAFIEDLYGNAKYLYKSATVTVMSRRNYIISLGSHPHRQLYVLKKDLHCNEWLFYGVNCSPSLPRLKKKLKKILRYDTMRELLKRQSVSVHEIIADCIGKEGQKGEKQRV